MGVVKKDDEHQSLFSSDNIAYNVFVFALFIYLFIYYVRKWDFVIIQSSRYPQYCLRSRHSQCSALES